MPGWCSQEKETEVVRGDGDVDGEDEAEDAVGMDDEERHRRRSRNGGQRGIAINFMEAAVVVLLAVIFAPAATAASIAGPVQQYPDYQGRRLGVAPPPSTGGCDSSTLAHRVVVDCLVNKTLSHPSNACCDAVGSSMSRAECWSKVLQERYLKFSPLSSETLVRELVGKCEDKHVSPESSHMVSPREVLAAPPALRGCLAGLVVGWVLVAVLLVLLLVLYCKAPVGTTLQHVEMTAEDHPNGDNDTADSAADGDLSDQTLLPEMALAGEGDTMSASCGDSATYVDVLDQTLQHQKATTQASGGQSTVPLKRVRLPNKAFIGPEWTT